MSVFKNVKCEPLSNITKGCDANAIAFTLGKYARAVSGHSGGGRFIFNNGERMRVFASVSSTLL